MKLNTTQIKEFERDGYLILESVFSKQEVKAMQSAADEVLEMIVNSSLYHSRQSTRLDMTCCEQGSGTMMRKIQPINDLSLTLAKASTDERLIGPMRQLMNDEPILMEEKLNYKQPLFNKLPDNPFAKSPRPDSRFPIHNDWAYYKAQNYPQSIISSAISLDDCTKDSGPLRIWPGSHKIPREHIGVENLGLEIPEDLIDHNGGEDVLAPAGSVMLFHSLLVHNSRGNTSNNPRRLMIYSHYPKKAKMGHDVRNGPTRLYESPYEMEYLKARAQGRFIDQYRLLKRPELVKTNV